MGAETETAALIEGLEQELALYVSSRDRLPLLDTLQCAQWAVEGQEVISRGSIGSTTSLKRNGSAVLADDRTTGRTTTGCRVGLVVTCVEIAISFSVLGRVAVQTTNDARQDTKLFTCIVTYDANLDTDCKTISARVPEKQGTASHTFCLVRGQVQAIHLHVFERLWVVA